MDDPVTKVLLVEDNPGYALLLGEMIAEAGGSLIRTEVAGRLSEALERLGRGGVDVVLLDLTLPDSEGLDTLARVRGRAPDAAVVILTSLDDEQLAYRAVKEGAQDFLVKARVDGHLLVRSIRYAAERQRLVAELERTRQERALRQLDDLSAPAIAAPSRVSAARLIRDAAPTTFDELVEEYAALLERAFERRMYRVEYDVSRGLRTMADRLGSLEATPKDAIEVHSVAYRLRIADEPPLKAQAYGEEANIMLLELMGHMASYYRSRALEAEPAPNVDSTHTS